MVNPEIQGLILVENFKPNLKDPFILFLALLKGVKNVSEVHLFFCIVDKLKHAKKNYIPLNSF